MTVLTYDPLADALAALLEATTSRWGVVVVTDDVDLCKSRLYKAKHLYKEVHPEIVDLSIRTSPDFGDTEVWIAKSNLQEAAEEENAEASGKERRRLTEGREANIQIPDNSSEDDSS